MTTTSKEIDLYCPVCDQPNSCAVSLGKTVEECWCNTQSFSKATLEKIPEVEKRARCLCPTCASKREA